MLQYTYNLHIPAFGSTPVVRLSQDENYLILAFHVDIDYVLISNVTQYFNNSPLVTLEGILPSGTAFKYTGVCGNGADQSIILFFLNDTGQGQTRNLTSIPGEFIGEVIFWANNKRVATNNIKFIIEPSA